METLLSLQPVILCSDETDALWPLSRASFPKPFAPLFGGESLFQAAVKCLCAPGLVEPVVVTPDRYRFIVKDQLAATGIAPRAIIVPPEPRGRLPETLAAALLVAEVDPDAILVAVPADHMIGDPRAFRAALAQALPRAERGELVRFASATKTPAPAEAEPEANGAIGGVVQLEVVRRRAPGPAGQQPRPGDILLCRALALNDAVDDHAPAALGACRAAVAAARSDLGFTRLGEERWSDVSSASVEAAALKAIAASAPAACPPGWSDIADWNAFWQISDRDLNGTATDGNATAIRCRDTLLRSESQRLELVGIGLTDIVAVAMPDAVLVVSRAEAHRVPETVAAMSSRQATEFPVDHRPWGWFESLALGARFQVKRIVVKPGAVLSLQSHHHRAEHWIVVAGTARVTVDGEERLVSENQSIYVPLGAHHRLENPGKVPMTLIEVQTGAYLGEDDIIRYEDVYART